MAFPCNKCGACCRNIKNIAQLAEYDNGDGVCIHLTPDNLCDIYKERPIWCNIEKLYECKFSNVMTKQKWFSINQEICHTLHKQTL